MAAMTDKSETTQKMLERPAIQCSQGGVPFNDFHLKEKDSIIATLRANLAEAQASERERAAKVAEDTPDKVLCFWDRPGGPPGNGYAEVKGQSIIAQRIRSLSPTPNQEKPE